MIEQRVVEIEKHGTHHPCTFPRACCTSSA